MADGDCDGVGRGRTATAAAAGLSSGRKSFGCQASWGVRFADDAGVDGFVRQLAAAVADKAAAQRAGGRHVSVRIWQAKPAELARSGCKGSIGHGDCNMRSKAVTLRAPVADCAELAAHALRLVRALGVPAADVRGLAVALSSLTALPGAARATVEGALAGGCATPDRRAGASAGAAAGAGTGAGAGASGLGTTSTPPRAARGALERLWAVAEGTPVGAPDASAAWRKRPRDAPSPGDPGASRTAPVAILPPVSETAAAHAAPAPPAAAAHAAVGAPAAADAVDVDAIRAVPRFGGGGGGWAHAGDYFRNKKVAQSAAHNDIGGAGALKGRFLKGVVLWVDGHTEPPVEVLREMLCAHGGAFVSSGNFGKAGVSLTHVVTQAVRMGMVEAKLSRMALAAGGSGCRRAAYVRPQWLVESVAAGKQLDTRAFLVDGTYDPRQQTLQLRARADDDPAAKPGAARWHEQLPAVEAWPTGGEVGDEGAWMEGEGRGMHPRDVGGDDGESDGPDVGGGGYGGYCGGGGFSQMPSDLPPVQQLDEATLRQMPREAQRSLRQGYANRGEALPPHLEIALRTQPARPPRAPPPFAPPARLAPAGAAAGSTAGPSRACEEREHAEVSTAAEVALVEMGFPLERVLAALAATPSAARADERTQAALDWLAPDDTQPPPPLATGTAAVGLPAVLQLDSSGLLDPASRQAPERASRRPERDEVDADFWRHMPESIRAELPELLLAQRAQQPPAAGAADRGRAPGVPNRSSARAAASASAAPLSRLMGEMKQQVYAWAAPDAHALEAVQTYAGVERLAELARGLAAAGDLESIETLVRFATRVLGPLEVWREALLTWLDDVDDAVSARYGAPLAQVRLARGALHVRCRNGRG
jgi:hypothetical protein